MAASTTDSEALATAPDTAEMLPMRVDRFRTLIRRREQVLLERGLMVRAGKHRLFRTDRLDEVREVLGE